MKKVLLTSTALVAFAGAASAEVSISGSAEMGIFGGTGVETQFFQDIDVTFTMSGETDGGLTFGASIDLDEAQDNLATVAGSGDCTFSTTVDGCVNDALDDVTEDGGVAIFISGSFGTVTMGDTDGAMDWALTDAGNIGNPGSIADDETSHAGYLGAYLDGTYDGQIVRYDNTFGDFGVAISVEMDETGTMDTGYALGFKYNAALGGLDLALGLGYQSVDGNMGAVKGVAVEDAIGFSAVTTFDNGLSAGIEYTQFGGFAGADDVTHLGLGFGYSVDAFSAHLNYGQYSSDDAGFNAAGGGDDITGYGLALGYDLGGGASVLAGYGSSDNGATTTDTWSLGLSMSF
ncbi:porin [Oceanicola sp. 502str15]|uniref:porin n=1 Tax=Oceanicola sp. 502str15 TaxID=2696061 RepID=UPI0020958457|nr:porin [Oceanicola sp. 502str15]MCO6384523.1 porin [Oceanicola sp. 502str15]